MLRDWWMDGCQRTVRRKYNDSFFGVDKQKGRSNLTALGHIIITSSLYSHIVRNYSRVSNWTLFLYTDRQYMFYKRRFWLWCTLHLSLCREVELSGNKTTLLRDSYISKCSIYSCNMRETRRTNVSSYDTLMYRHCGSHESNWGSSVSLQTTYCMI